MDVTHCVSLHYISLIFILTFSYWGSARANSLFFAFPRWFLRALQLDEKEVRDHVDVSVSYSSVVEGDGLLTDVLVVDDELKDDDESAGFDGFSCTLGFCWIAVGGF